MAAITRNDREPAASEHTGDDMTRRRVRTEYCACRRRPAGGGHLARLPLCHRAQPDTSRQDDPAKSLAPVGWSRLLLHCSPALADDYRRITAIWNTARTSPTGAPGDTTGQHLAAFSYSCDLARNRLAHTGDRPTNPAPNAVGHAKARQVGYTY